jgi:hypothetical protein
MSEVIGVRVDPEHRARLEEIQKALKAKNPDARKITLGDALRWCITNSGTPLPAGLAETTVASSKFGE